jgi:exportin-2 (importin alpha re-exporter)
LVLDKIFMPLTELFVAYSNGAPMDNSRITNLTKMVSIYHSLLSQDLPEIVEDNLKAWIDTFTKLFSLTDLPGVENSTLDALWDEVCIVITVYAQRYEEEIQPHMQTMVTLIWNALNGTKAKGGQFTKSGLLFIATLAVRPHYQELFVGEGIIEMLLGNVIWPNVSYSDEDRDLLEDDPVAFFKQDLDGFDKETVRGAAVELLRALSSRFEEKVVQIISPVINSEVQKYHENPAANWKSMNAVCSTIVAICSKTETQKYGATNVSSLINVNDFCTSIILPELRKEQNHLLIVADAFKFIVTFRNQLTPDILTQFFIEKIADKYLRPSGAENPILRLYAAFAIERLLMVKIIRDNKAELNGYLLTFSDNLIASLSQPMSCDNCYILKCLYRCITYLQPETLASKCLAFTEIMQSLIDVALRKTILVDTLAVHFGFETICWFIKKCYILPPGSRYQFYHTCVLEIIYSILKSDNRDFVPYALQLACELIEQFGHEIEQGNDKIPTDEYETFFGNLINSDIWQQGVNVPAFVMVLRSYIRRLPRIALSGDNAGALGRLAIRFINSKLNDQHGFLLASQFIRYLDRVNGLSSRDIFFAILQRLTTGRTSKFVRHLFVFWMRYIAIRGPKKFEEVLNNIQQGIFQNAYQRVIISDGGKDSKYATNVAEKRYIIIGIIQMFRRGYVRPENAEYFISLGLDLVEAYYAVKVDQAETVVEVTDTGDHFNKLSNVHIPETFDGTEFDVRGEFVRCAFRFTMSSLQEPLPPKTQESLQKVYTFAFPNGLPDGEQQWQQLDSQLESLDSDELPFGLK